MLPLEGVTTNYRIRLKKESAKAHVSGLSVSISMGMAYDYRMGDLLKHTLLGIPVYTWILQLLYVAAALSILSAFVTVHKRASPEIVLFVVGIVVVDVAWRLAIK